MSKHSATGSFAGYLFQIERVLYWVSKSDVRLVALETEDDIVAQFAGQNNPAKILEQAKHSLSSKVPYSNKSVDLWKTLSIWVSQITDNEYDHTNDFYSLVSNKALSSNRLIKKVIASRSNLNEFKRNVKELLEIAKNPSKEIKEYAELILKCPLDEFESLLMKVEIHDSNESISTKQLKDFLRINLAIGKNVPIEQVYRDLLGFVTENIISNWRMGEDFTLHRETVINETNRLIAAYYNKTFVEKTVDSLPVSKEAVEMELKSVFVEQLRLIQSDDQDILSAIQNFLRAETEKSRFALEGDVMPSAFEKYYEELKAKWDSVFKKKKRLDSSVRSPEDIGFDIYYSTKDFKGTLNGQEPQQRYTYEGAYHYLSNQFEIGWHPNWKIIFEPVEV